jgi:ribonucleoside-diphosphate reductase alpha chain
MSDYSDVKSESDYSESDLDDYQGNYRDDYDESIYKEEHYVIKRDGRRVETDFNKINERLLHLATSIEPRLKCNVTFVTQKTISTVVSGSKTTQIDEQAATIAEDMSIVDPDFGDLACRIAASNHQKNTLNSFSDTVEKLYQNRDHQDLHTPRVNDKFLKFVRSFNNELDSMIDHKRDFNFTYFGFNTILAKYLLKRSISREEQQNGITKENIDNRPQDFALERPQYMWMRMACAIGMNRKNIKDRSVLNRVREIYDALSLGFISLASPMLFNLGTLSEQLLSCFLTCCEDSKHGIKLLEWKLATISANSGGVSWWWHLRASGAEIKSTNGHSCGSLNFMKGYENTAINFDQGGKRPGSFANYVQPMDPIFMEWIKLKRQNYAGKMHKLFYGLFMPKLFMNYLKRAIDNDEPLMWYFFDSARHDDLYKMYGDEFNAEYEKRVAKKEYVGEPMLIKDIWDECLKTWNTTSIPYVLNKDSINRKSNQMNLGTILSSNLCCEITEFSTPTKYDKHGNIVELGEFGCCNLGTLCLPKFVKITYSCDCTGDHKWNCSAIREIDYKLLHKYAKFGHEILDDIIDITEYVVPECENSNKRHRPVSMGVMGLADAFHLLRLPFTSSEAQQIDKNINEVRAHGAWERSAEIAKLKGAYPSFNESKCVYGDGCPMANGIFQWQMWGIKPEELSGLVDWNKLREFAKPDGYRNSLCLGNPPTASTSQIKGLNECFEPYSTNCYVRETNIGEHLVINKQLLKELIQRKLWTPKLKRKLINNGGSVQKLPIPDDMKELYKTAFEMSSKTLIDMMAARDAFTDQSSSNNQWMMDPNDEKITRLLFYTFEKDLKTNVYYFRFMKNDVKAMGFSESIMTPESAITTPITSAESIKQSKEEKNKLSDKLPEYFAGSCSLDGGCTL